MKRLFYLIIVLLAATSSSAQQLIKPAQPSIKSVGRIDKSNPDRYRFDSPGVYFAMKFSGSTSISARLKGSPQTYFQAFINGQPVMANDGKQAIYTSIGDTTIILSNRLSKNKEYEVLLFKRTENLDNKPAEFMGFLVDNKATIFDAATLYKPRKMEFIGNSITCAFGTESKNKNSKFEARTENNYLSYALVLARAFDADVQVTARSGHGVVRNYNDKSKMSAQETTVPKIFERTFDSDKQSIWDFSYKPDVVVINLGTNDYSTLPHPDKAVFIDTYLKFIARIRALYGTQIPVFCVVGPMIDEPCYSIVKEMVEIQRTLHKDTKTYFIGIPTAALDLAKDFGAATHPGGDGQKKMAQIVAPVISSVTGWSYNRTEMDDIKGSQDFYSRE